MTTCAAQQTGFTGIGWTSKDWDRRDRELNALHIFSPCQIERHTVDGVRDTIKALDVAIKADSARGAAGHWAFDFCMFRLAVASWRREHAILSAVFGEVA